jgi:hypothetical protein
MWILGIPMIDRHPIEPGVKILLGLSHKITGKGLQIGETACVVRRHDEPEVMAISLTSLTECSMIGVIALRIEHTACSTVPGDTVAAQIREMRAKRRTPYPMPNHARFDHGPARSFG